MFLGGILLCLNFLVYDAKTQCFLIFVFSLNFPLKKSVTTHLIFPVGDKHRYLRKYGQCNVGYRLPVDPGKLPTATTEKNTKVQITFKVSGTIPLTFPHVSYMWVWGSLIL